MRTESETSHWGRGFLESHKQRCPVRAKLSKHANYVKISGRQNLQANIFQLVHNWLCDARTGKWALVLDNMDDADFLKARRGGQNGQTSGVDYEQSLPLISYLPYGQQGSILITSRSEKAALQLVGHEGLIKVDPMDNREPLELFERKLRSDVDNDGTDDLSRELESISLAITQAAAYIRTKERRCSVRQYLQERDRKKQGSSVTKAV